LHKYNLSEPEATHFVGLENYVRMLKFEEFWTSLRLTLQFTFGSVTLSLIGGLLIALLLNESFKGRGILRSLALIPWAIPPVVNGILWKWIFDAKAGFLNALLWNLGIIESYKGWLADRNLVLPCMVWAYAWNAIPFAIIVFLSALQAIPLELYDAAKVDRASVLQRFRHVTLPWMLQPILIVAIVQTTYALRAFDIVYTLTFGGPGDATTFLSWRVYLRAFRYFDFGMGNTYAFGLAFISIVLALFYFRILYARGRIEL
jgi:multiple sugar transport system permease protein